MNLLHDWLDVRDEQAASRFLDVTKDLHDTVAVSATWIGAESVDADGNLDLAGYGDLRLEIQSQFRDVGQIQLELTRVQAFEYDYEKDAFASFSFRSGAISLEFGSWKVRAQALRYRRLAGDRSR